MIKKILLDNGHGKDTPGKKSPKWANGTQLFEWEYAREIAQRVWKDLKSKGVDIEIIVTEDNDIPLKERCDRANQIAEKTGISNTLLVSIHCNAANGNARGWEIHTSHGKTKSDEYADVFWKSAQNVLPQGTKMRGDFLDGDKDWDNNFFILTKTKCPAVLTENLFMDNEADCQYLLSEEGKKAITKLHVDAILKIVDK